MTAVDEIMARGLWVGGRRSPEYQESLERQTRLWIEGIPWHNTVSDECTCDFSCCVPELLERDKETRIRKGNAALLKFLDFAPLRKQ